MYTCTYFPKDSSLSVVSEKSKSLQVLGEFKEKESVKMRWGKDIYSGTIIKIHESEDLLNKFATKAYKKILKGSKLPEREIIDSLIKFSTNISTGDDSVCKRKRMETIKSKESKEQAEEFSPKKKRKNVLRNKGNENAMEGTPERGAKTPAKRKAEKKKVEDKALLAVNEEILNYEKSSLAGQFENENSLSSGDNTAGHNTGIEMDTPLTTTWAICQNRDRAATIPVPPPEVLEFFKALSKPGVLEYCQQIVQQFSGDKDKIYFMETQPETERHDQLLSETERHDQLLPFHHEYPHYSGHVEMAGMSHIPAPATPQRWSPARKQSFLSMLRETESSEAVDLEHNLTQAPSAQARYIQSQYSSQPTPLCSATPSLHSAPNLSQVTTCTNQAAALPSAPVVPVLLNTVQAAPISDQSSHSSQVQPNYTFNERRSPRKHASIESDDSDGAMVKLLASSQLVVKRENLRKAQASAKKASNDKKAFTLTGKLLQTIFTCEEMASSRGQGLKSKEGDLRPVLDPKRLSVIKDYVTVWCEKNGTAANEKDINDAITEQVSYARKKMRTVTTNLIK